MPFVVMLVFGTRPEAIKMAPLISRLRRTPFVDLKVCLTGQHREMLAQVLEDFELVVDDSLTTMQPGQTLNGLSARLMEGLDDVYARRQPDMVVVHGDTTTCFAATLAAFQRRIPVAHVEAGLRTGNLQSPWPEEANRRLTGVLADLHFAPTPGARDNLLQENVAGSQIIVTGNTVIDALLWMRKKILNTGWQPDVGSVLAALPAERRMVLVTGHRRESFGSGLQSICRAVRRLAERYPDTAFVYPVHLNPSVQDAVHGILGSLDNVYLTAPLNYRHFVWAMERSYLILTDSGGVQEEAPSLGKPVLVMRDTTERPEGLVAGTLRLTGVTEQGIFDEAQRLLEDPDLYAAMSGAANPFGDGRASERIAHGIVEWLRARHSESILQATGS